MASKRKSKSAAPGKSTAKKQKLDKFAAYHSTLVQSSPAPTPTPTPSQEPQTQSLKQSKQSKKKSLQEKLRASTKTKFKKPPPPPQASKKKQKDSAAEAELSWASVAFKNHPNRSRKVIKLLCKDFRKQTTQQFQESSLDFPKKKRDKFLSDRLFKLTRALAKVEIPARFAKSDGSDDVLQKWSSAEFSSYTPRINAAFASLLAEERKAIVQLLGKFKSSLHNKKQAPRNELQETLERIAREEADAKEAQRKAKKHASGANHEPVSDKRAKQRSKQRTAQPAVEKGSQKLSVADLKGLDIYGRSISASANMPKATKIVFD